MPRFARFHVTGGLFHVISRFHDRRFYLDIEGGRDKYLAFLGNALASHDARVIAYCLMSSHRRGVQGTGQTDSKNDGRGCGAELSGAWSR